MLDGAREGRRVFQQASVLGTPHSQEARSESLFKLGGGAGEGLLNSCRILTPLRQEETPCSPFEFLKFTASYPCTALQKKE